MELCVAQRTEVQRMSSACAGVGQGMSSGCRGVGQRMGSACAGVGQKMSSACAGVGQRMGSACAEVGQKMSSACGGMRSERMGQGDTEGVVSLTQVYKSTGAAEQDRYGQEQSGRGLCWGQKG